MTDKPEETGKGPARPAEAAKRPYATLDLKATEVASKDALAKAEAKLDVKPEIKPEVKPDPARAQARAADKPDAVKQPAAVASGDRFKATLASGGRFVRSNPFLSHVAAGIAGALVVLIAAQAFGPGSSQAPGADAARLARVEDMLGLRPGAGGGLRDRIAAAEARAAKVDELTRVVGSLGDMQARLAGDAKALEAKIAARADIPQDIANRIAKLEQGLTALPARDVGDVVRTGLARIERDLAGVRTDAGQLDQRIDALRRDLDDRYKGAAKSTDLAPLSAKLAVIEQDMQGFVRSEAERNANASRIVLGLELGNLKRAMDRGEAYATELAAVKKAAGDRLDLAALGRYAHDGVATLPELGKGFRKVANDMLDAEAEPADAGLVQRLLTGARSIVRVRKAGHDPDDGSAEAVVARMEAALKDGRLAEVVAQAGKLPPKAALVGEDWVRKLEARHAVDQALAAIDAGLKSSLGAATDAKR